MDPGELQEHLLQEHLLLQHQIKVARLAKRLIEAGRIDAHEFIALMRQQ